ncbi:MAG: hypothetical protein JXR03_20800 [Cyclobacteriaceae bacterium]
MKFKSWIISLENKVVEPFCKSNFFQLDRERYYNETLAMNLYRNVDDVVDHIGFYYIDKKGSALFEFYYSKYYDTDSHRHSYKQSIGQFNQDSLETRLVSLLADANEKLTELSKYELKSTIALSR